MAIYTKTGDKGETSLANGERVPKTDVRIEAYGTIDELSSCIGLLRVALDAAQSEQLGWIQNKLFNIGAALSAARGEWIKEEDVLQLEQWIDILQSQTPKQHAFVLPAGGEAVCRCHVCRTVCRRAERRMIEAQSDAILLRFINRLSDYLFVLARRAGHQNGEKEAIWEK
ncbi:MAG: cob(I)yrinic acid a,c-diamide adenosyltransferase [Paludibacteraceae bacterium]|nr:cob(I)yrinic acid a,c-diamide adenosyltransferase [Paludibacteraceae bacterium]